jgi:hypothetical protein
MEIFLLHSLQIVPGVPPSVVSSGYWCSIRGLKRPVLEVDNLLASSAEVKNGGAILPHPIRLHTMALN